MAINSPETPVPGSPDNSHDTGLHDQAEVDLNALLLAFDPDSPELNPDVAQGLAERGVSRELAIVFTAGRSAVNHFMELDNVAPPEDLDIIISDRIRPTSDPKSNKQRACEFRDTVYETCVSHGLSEVVADAAKIITSEGITNKWRNAPGTYGRYTLAFLRDDHSKLVVRIDNTVESGTEKPPLAISAAPASETGNSIVYSDEAEHGRGLILCKGLADDNLFRYGDTGDATLWAELAA